MLQNSPLPLRSDPLVLKEKVGQTTPIEIATTVGTIFFATRELAVIAHQLEIQERVCNWKNI